MTTKVGVDYPDCNGEPLLDNIGSSIEINISTGLVRIDGMPVFRLLPSANGVSLQFADNDKLRSRARGTRFIEIPASVLFKKLISSSS